MYMIMNVIYGIPLTRKIDEKISEWEEDESCDKWNEDNGLCGFETMYSGVGDYTSGYCGVCLGSFEQFVEDLRIDLNKKEITYLFPDEPPKEVKIDLNLTQEQFDKANENIKKLDPEILKIAPKIGIYIVMSTS